MSALAKWPSFRRFHSTDMLKLPSLSLTRGHPLVRFSHSASGRSLYSYTCCRSRSPSSLHFQGQNGQQRRHDYVVHHRYIFRRDDLGRGHPLQRDRGLVSAMQTGVCREFRVLQHSSDYIMRRGSRVPHLKLLGK